MRQAERSHDRANYQQTTRLVQILPKSTALALALASLLTISHPLRTHNGHIPLRLNVIVIFPEIVEQTVVRWVEDCVRESDDAA
jgi:hypothetical protein